MKKLILPLLLIGSFSSYAVPGDPRIDPATRALENAYLSGSSITPESAVKDLHIGHYWRCSRYAAFGAAQEEHTFNIVFLKKGQVYHAFGDAIESVIVPKFFGFDNADLKGFHSDNQGRFEHTVRVDQRGSLITLWKKDAYPYYISCQIAQ